jgi:hypothetical protein
MLFFYTTERISIILGTVDVRQTRLGELISASIRSVKQKSNLSHILENVM